ncbi:MAG TPA: hypothetical protein VFS21_40315 [Roseiflexaceae bacterium]|nr:hypothetical protein [Roseiflexaceae bacterium]
MLDLFPAEEINFSRFIGNLLALLVLCCGVLWFVRWLVAPYRPVRVRLWIEAYALWPLLVVRNALGLSFGFLVLVVGFFGPQERFALVPLWLCGLACLMYVEVWRSESAWVTAARARARAELAKPVGCAEGVGAG